MRLLLCAATALCIMGAAAQNLQLHYDFGRTVYSSDEAGRPRVTATFECFKADRLGSWFYFIDIDFCRKGVVGAYMELSREFRLGKESPFAAHVEYDGGLNSSGGVFQPAGLAGLAWNGHNADFSATWSVQLMYKQCFKGYAEPAYPSAQLTGVWSDTFASGRLTCSGFIDFWRGRKPNGHGQLVVITEPQLWYNFSKSFSAGTEVEISNRFIYNASPLSTRTCFVNPTLALKWNL